MTGTRIKRALEALRYFLQSQPDQSYFNIYSFGSRHEALYKKSMQMSEKTLNETLKKMEDWQKIQKEDKSKNGGI